MGNFDFGERKLVNVNYTRYISLPKTWLRAMGIGDDGKVHVSMNEKQELILTPASANCQVDIHAGDLDTATETVQHEE